MDERPPPRRRTVPPTQPTRASFDDDEDGDSIDPFDDAEYRSSSSSSTDLGDADLIEVEIRSPSFTSGSILLPISKYSTILDLKQLVRL